MHGPTCIFCANLTPFSLLEQHVTHLPDLVDVEFDWNFTTGPPADPHRYLVRPGPQGCPLVNAS